MPIQSLNEFWNEKFLILILSNIEWGWEGKNGILPKKIGCASNNYKWEMSQKCINRTHEC